MTLKHSVVATGTDNAAFQVSVDEQNADHVIDTDGAVIPSTTTTPAAPTADNLRLFARKLAGQSFPAIIGPSGLDMMIQALWPRKGIISWSPPGNATNAPAIFGVGTLSIGGTNTAVNVATTNVLTRMRRISYVSAATAGSLSSVRNANTIISVGNGAGLGGFLAIFRFGVSDAAAVSGARMFAGLRSATGAFTNVEPNTLPNAIGVAQLSTDNTQWYMCFGGANPQTAVALGTGLGAPTLTNTAWELCLYSPATVDGVVYYTMTNLGSGVAVSGTIGPGTLGQTLPANTTLLTAHVARSNNATALAVSFDLCSIYIETDY